MLFLKCDVNPSSELKEAIREEIKTKTGEDCVILPGWISWVQNIPVKKERAVSPQKRLPWPFKAKNHCDPVRH